MHTERWIVYLTSTIEKMWQLRCPEADCLFLYYRTRVQTSAQFPMGYHCEAIPESRAPTYAGRNRMISFRKSVVVGNGDAEGLRRRATDYAQKRDITYSRSD